MAQTEGGSYADESVLVELLGDNPKVKIIAALLSEGGYEVHISQLAEMAGLARQTIHDGHLEELLEWGIVEEGREVGSYQLYRLNVENPLVAELSLFQEELVFEQSDERREDETIVERLENKLAKHPLSDDEIESMKTLEARTEYFDDEDETENSNDEDDRSYFGGQEESGSY